MRLSRTNAPDLAANIANSSGPATIGDVLDVLEAWQPTKLKENMP
jgi:hypothetical protein